MQPAILLQCIGKHYRAMINDVFVSELDNVDVCEAKSVAYAEKPEKIDVLK